MDAKENPTAYNQILQLNLQNTPTRDWTAAQGRAVFIALKLDHARRDKAEQERLAALWDSIT